CESATSGSAQWASPRCRPCVETRALKREPAPPDKTHHQFEEQIQKSNLQEESQDRQAAAEAAKKPVAKQKAKEPGAEKAAEESAAKAAGEKASLRIGRRRAAENAFIWRCVRPLRWGCAARRCWRGIGHAKGARAAAAEGGAAARSGAGFPGKPESECAGEDQH